MISISAQHVDENLDYSSLVEVLRSAFQKPIVQPQRHHHTISRVGEPDSTLLLMPAWSDFSQSSHEHEGYIGVKIVTVTPGNNNRALPAIAGQYLLIEGKTGNPCALIDGQRLTVKRTAAASALAASYLAREDATIMTVFGAGALSSELVLAMASQRPIKKVNICNRSFDNGEKLANKLNLLGFEAQARQDCAGAVRESDIISCATLSDKALVHGKDVRAGCHIDLVGAYTPHLRESDDELLVKGQIYCDTRAGALSEAGDIVQAIQSGAIEPNDIIGDLFDLTWQKCVGRNGDDQAITVFKSVGAALEDLAAAIALYEGMISSSDCAK